MSQTRPRVYRHLHNVRAPKSEILELLEGQDFLQDVGKKQRHSTEGCNKE